MPYRLIVFDWDGTLMDSTARIVSCFRTAAAESQSRYPGDPVIRGTIGLELRAAISLAFAEEPADRHELIYRTYCRQFIAGDNTPTPLFPGVEAGLQRLRKAGRLLAVATGKGRRGLDRVMKLAGIADLFAITRCADETRSKPDPKMLNEILASTGIKDHETIVVGDSIFDMQMAQNAQVAALAVSYGVASRADLLAHGAETCADQFAEVVDFILTAQ